VDAAASIAVGIAAFSAVALPATWGTFVPQSRLWGKVICRGNADSRHVALTLDDGPTEPYTGQILDLLHRARAGATFFVVGRNAQRAPELITRMQREGHEIGNHTWSHPHYGWLRGIDYWRRQIQHTDELVENLCGVRPSVFRPPLGAKNVFTVQAARQAGHRVVMWSRRSFDGLVTTPAGIMKRLEPSAGGDIILMHDGVAHNNRGRDPTATVKALELMLQMLAQRGLNPVTVSELLDAQPG